MAKVTKFVLTGPVNINKKLTLTGVKMMEYS